jgi:hypothetical protein
VKFNALLEGVFGEDADHKILPDFMATPPAEGYVPSYLVHIIKKKGE